MKYTSKVYQKNKETKLSSYFKLRKKIKRISNGCTPLCYDSPIREKDETDYVESLQANVIVRKLICHGFK
jgi:hypothetical protein